MLHAFMFRETNSSNKYFSLNNGWAFIQLFSLEEKSDFLKYRENTLRPTHNIRLKFFSCLSTHYFRL